MSILCLYFYVTPLQIQFPSLYINQHLLLNSFFKIFMSSNAAFEVESAWYLHSLPIHLLLSLFPVICLALELLIIQTFLVPLEGLSYQESNCTFNSEVPIKDNKKKTLTHNSEANVDANSTMPRMRDPKPKKWNAILSCHGTGSMIANKNVKAENKITMDLHWFHMLLHTFMLQYLCTCITYAKTQAMTAPFPLPKGKAAPTPLPQTMLFFV